MHEFVEQIKRHQNFKKFWLMIFVPFLREFTSLQIPEFLKILDNNILS